MFWKIPGLGKIGRIGVTPPRPERDRAGLAISLIVRNEERHVREWAEFHARAGVRRFVVYDNGCTDATMPILSETLGDALIVVPWRQVLSDAVLGREIHNQVLAYAHAASNFGGAFRWMAFIDVDEFLIPTRADSLPEALAELDGCVNVSLPWHMFGHSGHETPPKAGVLRSYTRRAADPMSDARGVRAFKCLVDPCALRTVGVHRMDTGDGTTCNDRGRRVAMRDREKRDFYSVRNIRLNHYYARSRAELDQKIGRGPNLVAKSPEYERKVRRTVANIEADEIEDQAALDYLARIGYP
jgi:hypothetical protein